MIKTQNNNKFKKVLLIGILNLFVSCNLFLVSSSVLAQDATPSSTSTDSSSIRDKVRQAIENLANKPKAVLGSLEQISESTLQIKDEDGKLQQVATTDKTTYARISAKNKKTEIKFTDMVIGDFVTALGQKNGNGVLEAKRVIAYDEKPTLGRQAVFGDITESSKNIITVKHPKLSETWTIETDKDTIFTKKIDGKMEEVEFGDLEIGDRVVAAGLLSEKKEKTISGGVVHVIPGVGLQKSPAPSASPKATPKATSTPRAATPKPSPTATPAQ